MPDNMVASIALFISFLSLAVTMRHRSQSFRPIASAMVKTRTATETYIAYDLVVLNSGTLPARNIQIMADESSLVAALGRGASEHTKELWFAAFNETIYVLHSNASVSCSFGRTERNDTGFWKPNAVIPITIRYEHWFRRWKFGKYNEKQKIKIADSDSFTGHMWGSRGLNSSNAKHVVPCRSPALR
jgi:hypothetical protein